MQRKSNEPREKLFEELVIDVKSVVKVTKGGRRRRYSATVVVGDRKGKVGLGIGKANEKPAPAGTGIIAGGSVRAILELAGIRDVVSKSLGARTKINTATAALNALKAMKTVEQVAALRGKTVEEILG